MRMMDDEAYYALRRHYPSFVISLFLPLPYIFLSIFAMNFGLLSLVCVVFMVFCAIGFVERNVFFLRHRQYIKSKSVFWLENIAYYACLVFLAIDGILVGYDDSQSMEFANSPIPVVVKVLFCILSVLITFVFCAITAERMRKTLKAETLARKSNRTNGIYK